MKDVYELDAARWSSVSGSDEFNQLKEETFAWARANLPMITIVEQVKYPMIANTEPAQRGECRLCHCLELRRRTALV